MRKFLSLIAIGLGISIGAAQAQGPKMQPMQDKTAMSACEKAAGSRKGDERKSFMVSCVASRGDAQQSKVAAATSSTSSASSYCHHASAEDL